MQKALMMEGSRTESCAAAEVAPIPA